MIVGGSVLAGAFGFLEQAQRNAYRQPTEQSAAAEYEKDWWEDTLPQWLMSIFAIAATGVGIWTILLLNDTLKATRRSNRDARHSTERQLRAYVGLHSSHIRKLTPGSTPVAHVVIINSGQTPAYDAQTVHLAGIAPFPIPPNTLEMMDRSFDAVEIHEPTIIGPGGEVHVEAAFPRALTAEDITNLQQGNIVLIARVRTTYKDAFNRSRWHKTTLYCGGRQGISESGAMAHGGDEAN